MKLWVLAKEITSAMKKKRKVWKSSSEKPRRCWLAGDFQGKMLKMKMIETNCMQTSPTPRNWKKWKLASTFNSTQIRLCNCNKATIEPTTSKILISSITHYNPSVRTISMFPACQTTIFSVQQQAHWWVNNDVAATGAVNKPRELLAD